MGVVLASPFLALTYCLVLAPYLERRPIQARLEAIPGLTLVETRGDEDIGISALVVRRGGGTIEFEGLSEKSFSGGVPSVSAGSAISQL